MGHPEIPNLEYNYITDGIFVGTNKCCQTHFNQKLKSKKITAEISLEGESVDAPYGIKHFVWLPVVDHKAPTTDQLKFGVTCLEKFVSMGKKVYVHCKNGHGRAPTLVIAYFIKKGMSFSEAEKLVKSKRPSIHLEKVQREKLINFQ